MNTDNNMRCECCASYDPDTGWCTACCFEVYDWERCYRFQKKVEASELWQYALAVAALAIVAYLALAMAGCSRPDIPEQPETAMLEVSDRNAPQAFEEQEPMDIEEVENLELECEEVAAMDEGPSEEVSIQYHSVLTMSGGVNHYNGKRETWYSSNVLRHYRIGEWHAGDDGVWRDADGYVIIASSDMPMGAVHETSLGMAKVYDTGCPAGTVDIYVNW